MSDVNSPGDDLLRYTQSRRLVLFGALEEKAKVDPTTASVAVKILADIDKQILAQQRLAIEKDNGNRDRETALLIANMNAKIEQDVVNPFRKPRSNVDVPDSNAGVHQQYTHTQGEQSVKQLERFTYDTFMAKMDAGDDSSPATEPNSG